MILTPALIVTACRSIQAEAIALRAGGARFPNIEIDAALHRRTSAAAQSRRPVRNA
jgi:hypothetical protein